MFNLQTLFISLIISANIFAKGSAPPSGSPDEVTEPALRTLAAHVVPTKRQVDFQATDFYGFIHLGMNNFTYTINIGTGKESPKIFDPYFLDTDQWASTVKAAGMRGMILTTKHHDGFCLWPSNYTDHSVKSAKWRGGKGDIVAMAKASAKKYGLRFGVYYSLLDMHEGTYGTPAYYNYVINQLTELLTRYGKIDRLWIDPAYTGTGKRKEQPGFSRDELMRQITDLVKKITPDTMINNIDYDLQGRPAESGLVPEPHYNVRRNGNSFSWRPSETVTTMRRLWGSIDYTSFWFTQFYNVIFTRTNNQLLDVYYRSVGHGTVLVLNLGPDKTGLIPYPDKKQVTDLGKYLHETFSNNLMADAKITASSRKIGYEPENINEGPSYWTTEDGVESAFIDITLPQARNFDVIGLQENIWVGQRIEQFNIEGFDGKRYVKLAEGTTVGYKKLVRLGKPFTTNKIRINILRSRVAPTLLKMGLFKQSRMKGL